MTDVPSLGEFQTATQLADTQAQLERVERRLHVVENENVDLREILRVQTEIRDRAGKPPRWAKPSSKKPKQPSAIANLFLSDWHFDAVIDPVEVEGINAYNREIATLRLRRCVERAIHLADNYLNGVTYAGAYVWLGGDMVSGTIHDELRRTNADEIMGTVAYWVPQLQAALTQIGDFFGNVHVAGVVGNHGRITRKPVAKRRVRQNWDWLIYHLLSDHFSSDPRFTFDISEAADTTVSHLNTRYLLTHGDQFRGGHGIAGIWSALMLGQHRKTRRQASLDNPFDVMLLGHFHQLVSAPLFIVNGSGCGYDEYAYTQNFPAEPPQQAFWICTPEHGPAFHAPILVADRKKEGW